MGCQMSKMFKENGFFSEEGEKAMQPLYKGLKEVITSSAVREMSVQELRVLQANLASLVGNTLSNEIHARSHQSVEAEKPAECTGHWWRDEYGSEAFVHDEFTYCPAHDNK